MRFTLVVHADPLNSQAAQSAYEFAKAAAETGHSIHTIFFYSSGVYVASNTVIIPQDEASLHSLWIDLEKSHNIKFVVCIAAAIKRGLLDQSEAQRYDQKCININAPFELGGLGQLIEAMDQSDRCITFS